MYRKRTVYLLTTGGTIVMRSTEAGVVRIEVGATMALASQLGALGIEVKMRDVMQKESENITPYDWKQMAEATADVLKAGVDGVVILHGSDTMHYTASALSFMLRDLSVPVVLTGSMIPGSDPGSEALSNLKDAVVVAAFANFAEVCIVFSADLERSRGVIIRGCRARKIHSYAINAFGSINVPPIGYVKNAKVTYTELELSRRKHRKLKLFTKLEPNVVLVKQNPALTTQILTRFLSGAAGAVIEGVGIGHVRMETDFLDIIASFRNPVAMSTQAIWGGEHLGMYALDRSILDVRNIIPTGDMNSETALVKLMWALGQEGSTDDIRSIMLTNIAGERVALGSPAQGIPGVQCQSSFID